MAVQNVVVLGAGPAGLSVVKELAPKLDSSKYQLVLVSPRPFFIHMPAGIRMNVTAEGKFEDRALVSLESYFKPGRPGKFINASAERIDAESVHLDNGETLPYAALVVATGSHWRGFLGFPKTKDEVVTSVSAWREKFKNAKSVLIVGGGAVGLELAGEVLEFYPKTEITLVHNDSLLLNKAYPASFRKKVANLFKSAGVKIILDDTVEGIPADLSEEITGPVKTAKGVKINADLIIPAVGPRPNASIIATLDPAALSPSQRAIVKPTLQVTLASGQSNVFASGDIVEWDEQHTSFKATQHAPVVAANVLSVLAGKTPTKQYKSIGEIIMITKGKSGGVAHAGILWGFSLPAFLVKSLKGQDLVVGMTTKMLGVV